MDEYISLLKKYKLNTFNFNNYAEANNKESYNDISFVNPIDMFWEEHIKFVNRFYRVNKSRNLILGLNPGKNGANKTSVAFTDPFNAIRYLNMDLVNDEVREFSSTRLFPLFLEAFDHDIDAFFDSYVLTNVLPYGATIPGIREDKNVKFSELYRIPEFKGWATTHLEELINIFNPRYIIAVGKDVHTKVREYLRYNNSNVIAIQAAHPAYATYFTETEKQRWINLLRSLKI